MLHSMKGTCGMTGILTGGKKSVLAYVICHMISIVHVITILMALETSSDKQIHGPYELDLDQ